VKKEVAKLKTATEEMWYLNLISCIYYITQAVTELAEVTEAHKVKDAVKENLMTAMEEMWKREEKRWLR
jgi:hypothetical protein